VRVTLVLLVSAAFTFAVAAARAVIVVQHGIAGVTLQMTKTQSSVSIGFVIA
jgi:hypothetical protein